MYVQLRREEYNGITKVDQSKHFNPSMITNGNSIRLNTSIQFQENDILTIFIPSDSRITVLTDTSKNTSIYLDCRKANLQMKCTSECTGMWNASLLLQSPGSGIPQIMIIGKICNAYSI